MAKSEETLLRGIAVFTHIDNEKTLSYEYPELPKGLTASRVQFGSCHPDCSQESYELWKAKCRLSLYHPPKIVPLKLEVGKQYIRRNGEISRVIQLNRSTAYPFMDEQCSYTAEGIQNIGKESPADLIYEACIDSGTDTTINIKCDPTLPPNTIELRNDKTGEVVRETIEPATDMGMLIAALHGDMKPSQQRIAEVGLDWIATLIRKNSDYGDSAWTPPILAEDLGTKAAILVRMSDKIKRLSQLRSNQALVSESYNDTIKDLGAYCLLYLAAPKENHESKTS